MSSLWYRELSTDQLRTIDRACAAFEEGLRSGDPVSIETELDQVSADVREPLFRELLAVEIEFRQTRGELLRTADYRARFPRHVDDIRQTFADLIGSDGIPIAVEALDPSETSTHLLTSEDTEPLSKQVLSRSPRQAPDSDSISEQFGRYQLIRLLGRGGMATVYLAHDTQLDRKVAIKLPVFSPHTRRATAALQRFYREARAMATLEHPHLCPVYDVGEIQGRHFLSMAYIDGQSLAQRIRVGPRLSASEATSLVSKLARALQTAHDAGVIHRDLKPSNIMLRRRQGSSAHTDRNGDKPAREPEPPGEPVIMDFGLASRVAENEADLTHSGEVIGSPAYMAPEQVAAEHQRIGPRTDVYALGVILYQLLCGRRPHEGSMMSILGQVTAGTSPPRPSKLVDIDPRLEALCLKAMASEVEDRFHSAAEMADALEQMEVTSGVKVLHPLPDPRSWLLAAVVGAALLVLLAVAITVVGLRTPHGDLVVRAAEGTNVEVEVLQDGKVVDIVGPDDGWKVRVEQGRYQLVLKTADRELTLDDDTVTVSRGGKAEVTIVRRPSKPSPASSASSRSPTRPIMVRRNRIRLVDSGQRLGAGSAHAVASADVDGDGDVDVFVANYHLRQPSRVWHNDGAGRFEAGVEIHSDHCSDVQLGDLDGDGDIDAVLAHRNPVRSILIYINEGEGTFQEIKQQPAAGFSKSVALGDVDADGDLDFVTAGELGANQVWFNDGAASFVDSEQRLGDSKTFAVELADLDGDGDLDLFAINFAQSNRVWLNDGKGVFTDSGQTLGSFNGIRLDLADIDHDGDIDAYVANANEASRVWINDGSAQFSPLVIEPRSFPSIGVAIADLNGDGRNDVLIGNGGHHLRLRMPCQILYAEGTGGGWRAEWMGSRATADFAIADLDGDGEVDAYIANGSSQPDEVWLSRDADEQARSVDVSESGESLLPPVAKPTKASLGAFVDSGQKLGNALSVNLDAGDVDGDGDIDVLVANSGAEHEPVVNCLYFNDGNGNFEVQQQIPSARTSDAKLGDLDGDGDLDAVFANRDAGQSSTVWWNDGQGRLAHFGQRLGPEYAVSAALDDLDGDGDLDIVLAGEKTIHAYLNEGGSFTLHQQFGDAMTLGIAMADLDGDGDNDAFAATWDGPDQVWLNDGSGSFSLSRQSWGGVSDSVHVALADLDDDGDFDAVVTRHAKPTALWINDGFGVFNSGSLTHEQIAPVGVAVADLNGDGRQDIFIGNGGVQSGSLPRANQILLADDSEDGWDASQVGMLVTTDIALEDFDGDGDLDAFLTNAANQPNRVWLNQHGPED